MASASPQVIIIDSPFVDFRLTNVFIPACVNADAKLIASFFGSIFNFIVAVGSGDRVAVSGYAIIDLYLQKLGAEPEIKDWEQGVTKICKRVFVSAMDEEVSLAKVVISTTINAGDKRIVNHFGTNSESIAVIADEHFRDDGLASLIAVTCLRTHI